MPVITGNHLYLILAASDNGCLNCLFDVSITYLYDSAMMCTGEAVRLSSWYNTTLETKQDGLPGNKYKDVL